MRSVEAIIEKDGKVKLSEVVELPTARRAIVTILDDSVSAVSETALLSESSLSKDWNKPEEDEAWSHLQ